MSFQLSVIIPAYNTEQYLHRCVDSVLTSDLQNYEIILVDDGSKDGTAAICDEYTANHSFIKVIHQENKGLPAARNAGLAQASGEYIYFMDSDDSIEQQGLQSVMDALLEDPDVQLACFGFTRVFNDGGREKRILYSGPESSITVQGKDVIYRFLSGPAFVWNKIFKKDLIAGIWFTEELRHAEDVDYVFRVVGKCQKAMVFAVPIYHYYCQRAGNVSWKLNDNIMDYLRVNRTVFEGFRDSIPTVGMSRCFIAAKTTVSKIPSPTGFGPYFRAIRKALQFRPGEIVAYLKDEKLCESGKQKAASMAVLLFPHIVTWLNVIRRH